MKLLKRSLQVVAIFAVAFAFLQSCADKANHVSPATATDDILLTSEFKLTDLDALENPAFTDATEDHEMTAGGDPHLHDHGPCAKIHHRMHLQQRDSLHHQHHLGLVFRRMNLDTNQLRQIRGYMREYCQCTGSSIHKIRNAHREIIARGNNQRHQLLIAYRNGRIDRTQFHNRILILNRNIGQALIKAPGKAQALQALKRCRHGLFTDIADVLNPQQLQMWRRWVQSHQ